MVAEENTISLPCPRECMLSSPKVMLLPVDSSEFLRSNARTGGFTQSFLIGLSQMSLEIGFCAVLIVPDEQTLLLESPLCIVNSAFSSFTSSIVLFLLPAEVTEDVELSIWLIGWCTELDWGCM